MVVGVVHVLSAAAQVGVVVDGVVSSGAGLNEPGGSATE
jgi:hypothetical protein